mmetsp:Transcript_50151/g.125901  ORF Transcript_50151/g.125901 Transcript_50151/m.125901 type:complete len:352 (-) Transcript_50151:273-1328(-)|eukprot:CAMPEP_0177658278 /NCGR_PEP_ID=MMETSP0447-20121125/16710_1 /TAXON_ID=0 /ORGANISM="Stygamoeba regulata, Strain BSH-02190019" /LENGTH=351 /DNA_ID=CAMNT_0019162843 /DNA_START=517 /DNA_END=1572 /DNA_ORIENTATION=-
MLPSGQYIPRLVLTKQDSQAQEDHEDDDGPTVHVVCRMLPFTLQFSLETTNVAAPLDLNRFVFDARPEFDSAPERDGELAKLKPLEFKATVVDGGHGLSVDCKIKLTTPVMESTLMRVRVLALDPVSQQPVSPLLSALSGPIRVVSKPDQLKNLKKKNGKKRTAAEMLTESVASVEEQQNRHQTLLTKIAQHVETKTTDSLTYEELAAIIYPDGAPPRLLRAHSPENGEDGDGALGDGESAIQDFETNFRTVMEAYFKLPPEERAERIKSVVTSFSGNPDRLKELLDMFRVEGFGEELTMAHPVTPLTHPHDCTCSDCNTRSELDKIEEFYKEVFAGVSTDPPPPPPPGSL